MFVTSQNIKETDQILMVTKGKSLQKQSIKMNLKKNWKEKKEDIVLPAATEITIKTVQGQNKIHPPCWKEDIFITQNWIKKIYISCLRGAMLWKPLSLNIKRNQIRFHL